MITIHKLYKYVHETIILVLQNYQLGIIIFAAVDTVDHNIFYPY